MAGNSNLLDAPPDGYISDTGNEIEATRARLLSRPSNQISDVPPDGFISDIPPDGFIEQPKVNWPSVSPIKTEPLTSASKSYISPDAMAALPPSETQGEEQLQGLNSLNTFQEGTKKLGRFGGAFSSALFHTLNPVGAMVLSPEQKAGLWEEVRKTGEEAPLDTLSNAASVLLAGYVGYQGLKNIPEVIDAIKSKAGTAGDWLNNKLYTGTRALEPVSEESLADLYANAPVYAQEEMRQSARQNPTLARAISRVHDLEPEKYTAEARGLVPPNETSAVPAEAPTIPTPASEPPPSVITTQDMPSNDLSSTIATKMGPQAQAFIPTLGVQQGIERIGMAVNRLSEVLGVSPESVTDAMIAAGQASMPVPGQLATPQALEMASNAAFFSRFPVLGALTKANYANGDPTAISEFADALKAGNPEATKEFMDKVMESPALQEVFPRQVDIPPIPAGEAALPKSPGIPANPEPWQMASDQFRETLPQSAQPESDRFHEQEVRQALLEGKIVPPEVLSQYPDLQKQFQDNLKAMREEVSQGEASQRHFIREGPEWGGSETLQGGIRDVISTGSTFPEYFQNKGYTKDMVLKAIDKQIAGEKLTPKQAGILEDLMRDRNAIVENSRQKEAARIEKENAILAEFKDEKLPLPENDSFVKKAMAGGASDFEVMKRLYTDKLTGAWNMAYAQEMGYLDKFHVTFDVDKFKQINDAHGHPIGNKTLIGIVQLANEMGIDISRSSHAGDEFQAFPKQGESKSDFLKRFYEYQSELRKLGVFGENGEVLVDGIKISAGAGPNAKNADTISYKVKKSGGDDLWVDKNMSEEYNPEHGSKQELGEAEAYSFRKGTSTPLPGSAYERRSSAPERENTAPSERAPELPPTEPPPQNPKTEAVKLGGQVQDQFLILGTPDRTIPPGPSGSKVPQVEDRNLLDEFKPDNQEHFSLKSEVVPGTKEFVEQDVMPAIETAGKNLVEMGDDVRKTFAPVTRGASARVMSGILRENLAKLAQKKEQVFKALEDAAKAMDKLPQDVKYDFIDKMESGSPQSDKALQPLADTLRKLLDDRRTQVQNLGKGKLEYFIEDYFPHIWKDPQSASSIFARIFGKRPLEGSKSFLKQRTIPTFKEGIEKGLVPVTDNPVELALLKIHEMDRYIMGQQTFKEMKDQGLAKFVRFGQKAPEGYSKIDDKIAKVYQYSEADKGLIQRGEYYAPEPAAKIPNNYLSPGLNQYALYRGFRAAGNLLNQAQLGMSAFHLGFVAMDANISKVALGIQQLSEGRPLDALKSMGSGIIGLKEPFTAYLQGDKILKEYFSPGSQGQEVGQMIDALIKAGGRVRMDSFYKNSSVESFLKALRTGNYIGGVLRFPFAAIEAMAKPIMEDIVPKIKLGVFADMARFEMSKLPPDATDNQIREALGRAWDSVDNRMGQIIYDNLFWNKAVKDLGLASVRSLGWNLGTFRELGGGGLDILKQAFKAGKGKKPEVTSRMGYLMALPFLAGLYGAIYQYLKTGKGPQELKDYYFPRTGETNPDGSPERVSLPTYMKDIYAYYKHPLITISHKLHPLLSMISQMLSNEDYYGTEIRNKNDPRVRQALDIVEFMAKQFEPFSIRNYEKRKETGGSTSQSLQSFMGITPAPASIDRTDTQERISETLKGQGNDVRTKEQFEKGQMMRQLLQKARHGEDMKVPIQESIKSGLTMDKLRNVARRSKITALQDSFSRLPMMDAMNIYEKATPEEKYSLGPIMAKKLSNGTRYMPGSARQSLADRWKKANENVAKAVK